MVGGPEAGGSKHGKEPVCSLKCCTFIEQFLKRDLD